MSLAAKGQRVGREVAATRKIEQATPGDGKVCGGGFGGYKWLAHRDHLFLIGLEHICSQLWTMQSNVRVGPLSELDTRVVCRLPAESRCLGGDDQPGLVSLVLRVTLGWSDGPFVVLKQP